MAFLNDVLKEEIFMFQPPGLKKGGAGKLVCHLYKLFYGLKQSPRTWYKKIDTELRCMEMRQNKSDGNMY
jgi:hypothetical protein